MRCRYCRGREQCGHTGLCNSGQELVRTVPSDRAQLLTRRQELVLLPAAQTLESACNAETGVPPLGRDDPWGRAWLSTPAFWPGESRGQRSLAGYSPWGHQGWGTTE